ncbi:hypothetical protein AB0O07_22580 [Streptomyces sp. NPDC093085]|uniref:hypothetical protein n=1 Tax=Streptomyces sp. NPDC093085 TaxID=3155068 RepID=UPI003437927A
MRTALLALRATGVVTVLVTAPVLGTVTPAQAHDSVTVTVIPSTAGPGDEVEIRAEGCKSQEAVAVSPVFTGEAKLARRAWGEDWNRDQAEAAQHPGQPVPLSGHARIKPGAPAGRARIEIKCDGHGHADAGSFDVTQHNRPDPGRPDHGRTDPAGGWDGDRERGRDRDHDRWDREKGRDHDRDRWKHHRDPWGPVRAGGGGMAQQLAADVGPAGKEGARPEAKDAAKGEANTADTAGPGTSHAVIGLVLAGVAAVAVAFRSVRRQRTAAGAGTGTGTVTGRDTD